ncbi:MULTISPECIES: TetR/AcrR family transcriptional regulator [unclassified Rhizobium]|uniref:TetR/AcrR family transcriptional regulator n=1 Tax=unclassified Rhizobium TaxID=2613769 RepID=UPI001AD95986|nr:MULTISPECIES: TetR/AcrR family transcriptional regulator [unclassified Rhizobium]MBO9099963.1 TetR/AcrR family transcriptional regulator [Rhizobium sp. L58/93]MBO9135826.1 TetR/AcrR family transcriptional regulator [Rhizobium sp. B209b/85]MBO9169952.1 TetR/AcrR family transcriptional regulator [Rhizobium sp. L245/93]MBO9185910.1 TetR/AcrR family transcriptional regulator [Rhizobium sp. E27B/91]QXZ82775.1 TetR/AcrR family transcriptional regulator [Rhizobium sp. K1/93]
MRVSREKFAENRALILEAACDLFREKGFDGIGVADIMKAAGLTHGGFYGHFESKEKLAFEASRILVEKTRDRWRQIVEKAEGDPLEALLQHYLSRRNLQSRACVFASLTQEVSRQGAGLQSTFSGGLTDLVDVLAEIVAGETPEARRANALSTLAAMMGAVILARTMDDGAMADEFLAATHRQLSRQQV